jgi:cytosine/adenosine deaminase-related metal-dependent hydrolase
MDLGIKGKWALVCGASKGLGLGCAQALAAEGVNLVMVARGADAMGVREALRIATRGGAEVLGRTDCGQILPGMRADLAVWDVSGLEAAGAWDPVGALLLCGPPRVRDLFVEGRQVVRDGHLATVDLPRLVETQNRLARRLADATA